MVPFMYVCMYVCLNNKSTINLTWFIHVSSPFGCYRKHKNELDGEVFEMLYTLTDFMLFKEMMLDYKKVNGSFELFAFWLMFSWEVFLDFRSNDRFNFEKTFTCNSGSFKWEVLFYSLNSIVFIDDTDVSTFKCNRIQTKKIPLAVFLWFLFLCHIILINHFRILDLCWSSGQRRCINTLPVRWLNFRKLPYWCTPNMFIWCCPIRRFFYVQELLLSARECQECKWIPFVEELIMECQLRHVVNSLSASLMGKLSGVGKIRTCGLYIQVPRLYSPGHHRPLWMWVSASYG